MRGSVIWPFMYLTYFTVQMESEAGTFVDETLSNDWNIGLKSVTFDLQYMGKICLEM